MGKRDDETRELIREKIQQEVRDDQIRDELEEQDEDLAEGEEGRYGR